MLVKDFMTPNVLTISEDKSMLEARELMKSSAFRRIPVVDDIKRVMGIITDGDVGPVVGNVFRFILSCSYSFLIFILLQRWMTNHPPVC